ncbi:hypothetical protein CR513_09934, partial [Mucuna pruriens]
MSTHLVPNLIQVGQSDSEATNDNSSSSPPPMELKPLSSHLKYAYLDTKQQLLVIIANNLHQEVQTQGMISMNPSSMTIAMDGQRWFTSISQDAEDQVHQSVMAS